MRLLVRVLDGCLVALFAVYLVFILAQVLLRFLRIDALYWSEELVRYLLVWSVLLGAALVTQRRVHVRVDILESLLPERGRRRLEIVNTLVLLVFAGVLCWAGLLFVERAGRMTASMLGVRMAFVYAVIPLTALLDVLFLVVRLHALLRGGTPPAETLIADPAIDTTL
jgi:TRAP-type C4-dicarboxylate transport system permease small subunit